MCGRRWIGEGAGGTSMQSAKCRLSNFWFEFIIRCTMATKIHPLPLGICLIVLHLFVTGCAVSDRSVIEKAQGFDDGIKPAEIKEPGIDGYFQKIGERIVQAAHQSDAAKWGPKSHFAKGEDEEWMFKGIQFHLVNSKTLNAFTTGGTHVYIYNELLQLCKNENELAAVMSHEFGHIYCRHVQGGQLRQYKILAGALGLGAVGYIAGGKEKGAQYGAAAFGAGSTAGNYFGMGYTREDEAQADQTGFHFYCLAGWDPNAFGDFFQTMIDKGFDTTPEKASDHPTLASRVKIARERAAKLPELGNHPEQLRRPEIATVSQFNRYKADAREAGKRTPDDKSLAKTQQLLTAMPRSCLTPTTPPDQDAAQQQILQEIKQKQAAAEQSKQGEAR